MNSQNTHNHMPFPASQPI